jgi:hypothetical protein
MGTDTRNRLLEALGIAESIAMRLRLIMADDAKSGRYAGEYADMARTLGDIEDRLYRKGEYAPENVGSVRGGAR